jgi:hypothetical protein
MQSAASISDHALRSRVNGIHICPRGKGEADLYLVAIWFQPHPARPKQSIMLILPFGWARSDDVPVDGS